MDIISKKQPHIFLSEAVAQSSQSLHKNICSETTARSLYRLAPEMYTVLPSL